MRQMAAFIGGAMTILTSIELWIWHDLLVGARVTPTSQWHDSHLHVAIVMAACAMVTGGCAAVWWRSALRGSDE